MRWFLLISALLLALTGCFAPQVRGAHIGDIDDAVSVYHDDDRATTCWVVRNVSNGTAISCLPDSALPKAEKK